MTDALATRRRNARTELEAKQAINAALELFQRRWTLKLLWELSLAAPLTFRELQLACDEVSASVLNARLAELREALLVEHDAGGYRLTAHGRDLMVAVGPMLRWAPGWAAAVARAGAAGKTSG